MRDDGMRFIVPADKLTAFLKLPVTSVSPEEAMLLASLGYVAVSIDGPGQGLSTGPPDREKGWISIEEIVMFSAA